MSSRHAVSLARGGAPRRLLLMTICTVGTILTSAAQVTVTGYVQSFDGGDITFWAVDLEHQRTYTLVPENNTLRVNYTRTASSWEWDQFHFTPPVTIDVTANPLITLRVQSTVNTTLSLKPVYIDDSSSWLDYSVIGDGFWKTISLPITGTGNRQIKTIYVYLDGGTTALKSGTMWLDDVRLGDSAYVVADFSPLERAVGNAQQLLLSSQEGDGEGQFPFGSKATLQAAVDLAVAVLNSGTTSQAVVDQAVWDLYDACSTFERNVHAPQLPLVDSLATKETRYLSMNLARIAPSSLLFGMQDATGYGVGWSGDDDRSDVKTVCGDYPALFSEDLNGVEQNSGVDRMRYRMTSAYNRGGVLSMCWHQLDPDNRGFYAADVNNERIVATILPGGSRHSDYTAKLKKIAAFFKSLRGTHGEAIPVIFRPYHEHTGDWFWWGAAHATTDEYNTLWRFTKSYLHDSLNVHNLIWAISPSLEHVGTGSSYFNIYPGDRFVDLFGADNYFGSTIAESDIDLFSQRMRTMTGHALNRAKLTALTEVGQEAIPTVNWFTHVLLAPIKYDTVNTNVAYAAVWRNASTTHHYAPYPGHSSVPDFLAFYNDPYTLFESDLPAVYQYPLPDTAPPLIVSNHDSVLVSSTTTVLVTVETDERAYARYSYSDESYQTMTHVFDQGEGGYQHRTSIPSHQGGSGTIYVRAQDLFGNTMDHSVAVSFMVDTLEAPIAWTDSRYPVASWNSGGTAIGTGAADETQSAAVRTIYFTRRFTLTTLPTALGVLVKSYGGAAAYVNNVEIGRINLPVGVPLTYTTDPTTTASFNKWFTLDTTALRTLTVGENVVSVEVHAAAGSSVQSFNSMMMNQVNAVIYPLGAVWSYFDNGYTPPTLKLKDIINRIDDGTGTPLTMALHGNYPNPFNPVTKIRYQLSRASDVVLDVYDILGRKVAALVNSRQVAGTYEVEFHAERIAAGVYLVRMRADDYQRVHKMLLIK